MIYINRRRNRLTETNSQSVVGKADPNSIKTLTGNSVPIGGQRLRVI